MDAFVTLFFLLADCVQSFMTDLSVPMVPSSVIFTFTLETKPLKSWARAWKQEHTNVKFLYALMFLMFQKLGRLITRELNDTSLYILI